jgi:hypothetical protein
MPRIAHAPDPLTRDIASGADRIASARVVAAALQSKSAVADFDTFGAGKQKDLPMVASVNGLSRLGGLVDGLNNDCGTAADELAELLEATHGRIRDGMARARANLDNLVKTADGLDAFNAKFGNGGPLAPLDGSATSSGQ